MELKEAIEHAEQKAQDLNCSCREDHRQLAKWLKELAARRGAGKTAVTKEFLGKIMELKDTIPMMMSDDYKERFKAEYYQLKIRCEKLSAMLERYAQGELHFKPSCSWYLLVNQRDYMVQYSEILEHRAEIEGINLGE